MGNVIAVAGPLAGKFLPWDSDASTLRFPVPPTLGRFGDPPAEPETCVYYRHMIMVDDRQFHVVLPIEDLRPPALVAMEFLCTERDEPAAQTPRATHDEKGREITYWGGLAANPVPPPPRGSCGTCRFWHLSNWCCRYPPEAMVDEPSLWPETEGEDWCGEHQPKEGT